MDDRTGERIPLDLELTDTDGHTHALREYLDPGRPVLLVLAYSRCAMLCNLVLKGLAEAIPELASRPGRDFELITVSIDPEETPHTAARHQATVADAAKVSPADWPFLVGSERAIRELADSLGFRFLREERSDQIAHAAVVFVLEPDGTIAGALHGVGHPPADIERALEDARDGKSARTGFVDAVLRCFRFDPTSRGLGRTIFGILRGLALALIAALGLGVLVLARRERRTRRS